MERYRVAHLQYADESYKPLNLCRKAKLEPMTAQRKRRAGGMGFSRLETIVVIQSNKDYEYDKKGHFPQKGE